MRYGILTLLLWPSLVALAADGQAFVRAGNDPLTQAPTSGIRGRVVLGPRCPVISPGMEDTCKAKPYQATLIVRQKETLRQVARVTTDRNGTFHVVLPPGTYVIEPLSGGRPPVGHPATVSVEPGKFTDITIIYDTGIR